MISIVSGFFNPLMPHHIKYIADAKNYGSVYVIVNNDRQVELKGSYKFLNEQDRLNIVKSLKWVGQAMISIDQDSTVIESIKKIIQTHSYSKFCFCNGGDRKPGQTSSTEEEFCKQNNIQLIYNVGGDSKDGSSTQALQDFLDANWIHAKPCPRVSSITADRMGWTTTFGGSQIPNHVRH